MIGVQYRRFDVEWDLCECLLVGSIGSFGRSMQQQKKKHTKNKKNENGVRAVVGMEME